MHPLVLLLVQLGVILALSRGLARLLRPLGQPGVIAEIVAGIALGPSLLGWLWPGSVERLFPPEGMPALSMVSQLGLVFFMFLVGLEFDPRLLQGRARSSIVISQAGIVVPFTLGALLAVPLHAAYAPANVGFWPFALFLGAAMSITAFPVLARILAERGLLRTGVGAIALACAAVDDVTAWCILAFVVAVARAEGLGSAALTTAMALAYIGLMWVAVRPMLARLGPRGGRSVSVDLIAGIFLLLLLSAIVTELIGIHALFGAFLLGALMPREGGLVNALVAKLEDFVTIVLLPLFFAFSGLRTHVNLLDDPTLWATTAAIIGVATLGKFGGSMLAARFTGLGWREAGAIGILMNTRGLMELIVLNIGLDLGVLSDELFTMMVIMALVTTWLTSPVLQWVYPRERMVAAPTPAAPETVLLCVSDPAIAPTLVTVAEGLVRGGGGPVVALHIERTDRPSAYLRPDQGPDPHGPLAAVEEQAAERGLAVRPISVASADPAAEIVRVAEEEQAPLVLLGTHHSIFGQNELGGTVRAVVDGVPGAVVVLEDRGLDTLGRVVVLGDAGPDLAGAHAFAERLRTRAGVTVAEAAPGPGDLVVLPFHQVAGGDLPELGEAAAVAVVRAARTEPPA